MAGLVTNPVKQREAIQRSLCGETRRHIAKEIGVDHHTVSSFLNRADIKVQIEKEKERLSHILPKATQVVMELIESFQEYTIDDIENRKLSYQATKDLLKGMGVYENNRMSINIQNNNQKVILPEVLQILQRSTIDLEENIEEIEIPSEPT